MTKNESRNLARLQQRDQSLETEIAERTHPEASSRWNEAELRDFIETASLGLHQVGPDGTILWANQAELELLGYTPEEYVGHHIAEFHADAPVIEDILTRLTRGEKLREYEARLCAKDGSIRHVLIDSSVLFQEGQFVHTRCFTRDISERKEAEARLSESEGRLRALLNASSDVIYRMSADWSEMRHLQGREFIADTLDPTFTWIDKYIFPEDQPHVLATIEEAIRTKTIFQLEHRVRRVDGSIGWTFSRAIPILNANGEILEWFGAAADVTVRKNAEEALRRMDQLAAAGRMAAVVAHEINNPLEAIVNCWYLLGNEPMSEESRRLLTMAGEELRRVMHITKQSLSFYRAPSRPEEVDVAALMEKTIQLLKPHAVAREVEIFLDCRNPGLASGHETELRQVFLNVLANAIEAGSTKVKVRIVPSFEWKHGQRRGCRITVADDGKGISKDSLTRVFEPFYTTKAEKGTGLGLWVSSGIVTKHGGAIKLRSSARAENHGTCVSIFLRAATYVAEQQTTSAESGTAA